MVYEEFLITTKEIIRAFGQEILITNNLNLNHIEHYVRKCNLLTPVEFMLVGTHRAIIITDIR